MSDITKNDSEFYYYTIESPDALADLDQSIAEANSGLLIDLDEDLDDEEATSDE